MAVTVAELLISIGVSVEGANKATKEIGGVTSAVNKVQERGAKLKAFSKTAATAFAAIAGGAIAAAGAIFKLVDSVTSAGDEIAKTARTAGLQAESFQRLAFAADRSGASTEDVAKAAKNVGKFFADAQRTGAGPFVDGLAAVGLRMEDITDLDFEQRLGVFADALKDIGDPTERLALSQKLLGEEAGPKLASLLSEGSEGIRALGDEAARLGIILDEDALGASEKFQDSITNAKATITGLFNEIGVKLIPVVEKVVNAIEDWVAENKDLIAGKVEEFIDGVVDVGQKLIPVLLQMAEQIGKLITFLSGTDGLIIAMGALGLLVGGLPGLVFAASLALGTFLGDVAADLSGLNAEIREAKRLRDEIRAETRRKEVQTKGVRAFTEILGGTESLSPSEFEDLAEVALRSATSPEDVAATESIIAIERGERAERAEIEGVESTTRFLERQDIRQKEAARVRRERAKKGKKAPKKEKELTTSEVTLTQLLGGIQGAQGDPKQLQSLIQSLARKTPSTKAIRPTVAVDFFNFQITQNFRGGDAREIGKESADAIRSEFEKSTAKTGQALAGNIVR